MSDGIIHSLFLFVPELRSALKYSLKYFYKINYLLYLYGTGLKIFFLILQA